MNYEEQLKQSIIRRMKLADELRCDLDKQAATLALCALDPVFWFNNFVWTYNPKLINENKEAYVPFDLFPKQVELVHFIDDKVKRGVEGAVKKSRDIGFTWVAGGYAAHKWLFKRGFKTNFGSRVEDYVDQIGNSDSIFEKIRILLERLPPWMMPPGFKKSEHDNFMRLINPSNGNTISGEAGKNMGRGGRSSLYVIDEGAYLEDAESVDRAIIANSDSRLWASSANGTGNLFHRKCTSGVIEVFTYHYRDDPRKSQAWADQKKAELRTNPGAWEAEYEIDFATSLSNVCINAKWVESSRRLYKLIKDGTVQYAPPEQGHGGLDVGAGKALSVLVPRFGVMVEQPHTWQQVDNITTTYDALDASLEERLSWLVYDATGVGNTVTSTLNHVPEKYDGIKVQPLNAGEPPFDALMPDERPAKQWFVNKKMQLWWRLRGRFQATHEFMLYLDGDEKGVPHEIDDLIALCDCPDLENQIAIPLWFKNEKGLKILESKKQLATRGISSPDFADALALTEADEDHSVLFTSVG